MSESFQTKVSIMPKETFGMPSQIMGPQKLDIQIKSSGLKIGGIDLNYNDVNNSALRSQKSLFGRSITLALDDGVNDYFIIIPNERIARLLPYELEELKASFKETIGFAFGGKWGVTLFCLLLLLMLLEIIDGYLST